MQTKSCLAAACCILGQFLVASSIAAARYTFTNVYDTTMAAPGGFSFTAVGHPSTSNGQIAFQAFYDGFNRHSIFLGDGQSLAPVVSDRDADSMSPFVVIENPSISNGEIAFVGYHRLYNDQGVFKYTNGTVTPISETGDQAPSSTFRAFDYTLTPGITKFPFVSVDDGIVAFRGVYGPNEEEGIFTGDGGPLTTIVKSGDSAPEGNFRVFGDPAISSGTVAFVGSYARSGQSGIFTASGGSLTKIARDGDPAPEGIFLTFGDPSISGETVAFQAEFGDEKQGIFIGNGGPTTTIVKTGDAAPIGTFNLLGYGGEVSPAIAGNAVAFNAFYGDTSYQHQGIFINRGDCNSPVITDGDLLFGSVVREVSVGKFGLDPDGNGTLAFTYGLDDGRSGIALAMLVPEQTTGLLVVMATVMTATIAGRRGSQRGRKPKW